jgi:hypothetical protein
MPDAPSLLEGLSARICAEFGDPKARRDNASWWSIARIAANHAPVNVSVLVDGVPNKIYGWVFDPGASDADAALHFGISSHADIDAFIVHLRSAVRRTPE